MNSTEENELALSKSTKSAVPHSLNNVSRHRVAVEVVMSLQGKANGKREYSSITINRYLLWVDDGNGPLKSMLILSIGRIALINIS